ncbi:MAG: hypothetical protein ACTSRP_09360 [Candidatus Helarchaeota archaeon]
MDEVIETIKFISETHKLEMNYKDYLSVAIMLIGAAIVLIFLGLMFSNLLNSGTGESSFTPPWRR